MKQWPGMAAPQFTDPEWWQQRPRQPQEISTTKVIVGTLVPTILIVAVVVAVINARNDGSAKVQGERSVAAFGVCMAAHGITAKMKSGSPAQQRALDDCRATLPSGTHVGNFAAGDSPDQQFAECMRDAGGDRSRGSGRFGRGRPSTNFLNTFSVCRSLIQSGPPQTQPIPTPTSTTPPIA
jgi:hypothetical protein